MRLSDMKVGTNMEPHEVGSAAGSGVGKALVK